MCTVLRKLMCACDLLAPSGMDVERLALGGREFATNESTAGMRATELPPSRVAAETLSAWRLVRTLRACAGYHKTDAA